MPALLIQAATLLADLGMFLFIGYYLLSLRAKEKELGKKETKEDTDYHQIVNDALSKERKILEDASQEASQIITSGKYVTDQTKQAVDTAMQKMIIDIQKEATETTRTFMHDYQEALKKVGIQSLTDFQTVSRDLKTELQKQVADFSASLLPGMEKELEEYKQQRLSQTEAQIKTIVQSVSQEVLNKSLSLEDHHQLLLSSLEKAKKEGMFN